MNLMKKDSKSVASRFLTAIGVPHTDEFTDRKFAAMPYAGTLKGFRDLLDEYDVRSEIRHFPDKNAIVSEGPTHFPDKNAIVSEGPTHFPDKNAIVSEGSTHFPDKNAIVSEEPTHFPDKNATGPDSRNAVRGDSDGAENQVTVPFLAMVLGQLTIVTSVGRETIGIMREDGPSEMAREDFVKQWNGRALFAYPDAESGEPDLVRHRRLSVLNRVRRLGIPLCVAVILIGVFIQNGLYRDPATVLIALFDGIGIFVCYLLLREQLHIGTATGDAICGFLQKGGCGKIMERDVSKIFGVIGWGEVGMAYFFVSLVALVAYPPCLGYLAIVNVCCLPYTVWSISYQKIVAKTWCTLCVTVQTLQWLLFGSYLLAGAWHYPIWPLHPSLFLLGFAYLLALLVVDRLMPIFGGAHQRKVVEGLYDNLRLNADVFALRQQAQPVTAPMTDATSVLFGDATRQPDVVVFSDPSSPKAAGIHRQVDSLLKKGLTVGYVFMNSSDTSRQLAANFIALYEQAGPDKTWADMERWMNLGKKDVSYFKKYALAFDSQTVVDELARQLKWQQDSYLFAAPTVVVGGHILDDSYTLADLIYVG